MASAPASNDELIDLVRKSGLADDRIEGWLNDNPSLPPQMHATAAKLVQDGLLTSFHARHMLTGKYKGFLLGQYKVLDQIGAGGMGVIFLAEHISMKRQVAIKVLPADKAADTESRERFYREARIVAALDHPNVVRAFDIEQNGETHFIVLEYIDGESLEHMLRRRGPLPFRDAADYTAQSARGLQHAHERGLVHRDIKPGNLLLDKSGTMKVLDMGLARFFEENSNLTTELCSGSVIGTADYMAPEQAVNSHEVDIRADIYSLGVTLYALLTGQPPYGHLTVPQKLLAHHMREPTPIQEVRPDVPDELADIVMKMMAKKPENRFQIPGEVDTALTDWIEHDKISAAQTATNPNTIIQRRPPKKPAPTPKKRWLWPVVIGGSVLAIAAVIAVVVTGDKPVAGKPTVNSGPAETSVIETKKVAKLPVVVPQPKVGQIRKYDTKGELVERIALSPDEKLLAGGSRTGVIKIWDVETAKLVKELKPHGGIVSCVAWSPSGKWLASCGHDGKVKIFDTGTWNERTKIAVPKGAVLAGAFSPDSKFLFTGGDDGLGRFWNVEDGTLAHSGDQSHEKPILGVAWSPDNAMVYTAGGDGTLRGWEAQTGKQLFKRSELKKVQMVAVAPDSKFLVSAGDLSPLWFVDAKAGVKLGNPMSVDKMATQWSADFSNDGTLLVASGNEGAVHVWDVETRTPYHTFTGHTDGVPDCRITRDGKHVFTTSKDKTVRLWALPVR